MKKLVFAMMMALVLGSVIGTATADMPWPACYPCDEIAASSK